MPFCCPNARNAVPGREYSSFITTQALKLTGISNGKTCSMEKVPSLESWYRDEKHKSGLQLAASAFYAIQNTGIIRGPFTQARIEEGKSSTTSQVSIPTEITFLRVSVTPLMNCNSNFSQFRSHHTKFCLSLNFKTKNMYKIFV